MRKEDLERLREGDKIQSEINSLEYSLKTLREATKREVTIVVCTLGETHSSLRAIMDRKYMDQFEESLKLFSMQQIERRIKDLEKLFLHL